MVTQSKTNIQYNAVGHFIFRLNLSFKPKLKPKFRLKPKLIRKNKVTTKFGLKRTFFGLKRKF